jgi:hypothetical protein
MLPIMSDVLRKDGSAIAKLSSVSETATDLRSAITSSPSNDGWNP